ncbi:MULTISPECIES: LysR family transcriptional regulator [unclassified Acinetobacter]|uniref:LysR family transcriptional regulator n=1 Tax=unclassified Acinetobacter TaxID=196816 RepID=UPI001211D606|nr:MULTISPECIES: LysR family transcriptional regulator [unclassified Acinetobacter]RZJ22367.1 MAG: LysR family transcriptional regulator [Acinetobacter sp.]
MELRQLQSFVTIVEQGSIGKAAQKLDVGTSALSQQISKLESELSTRLLQRSALGVTPTPAGLAFFKQAQLVLRHANQAIQAAQSSRLVGYVSVGFPPSTASILAVPFLKIMAERYPDIKVHLVESLSGNLVQLINSRQLDAAIIFSQDIDKNWSVQPLVSESMFLIGNDEFYRIYHLEDYLKQGSLPLSAVENLPLALPSTNHGLRKLVEQQHYELNVAYEIDGLSLLMNTVANLCVGTIQPGSAFMNVSGQHLNFLKITSPSIDRTNYLISFPEDELSPASLAAKAVIRSCMTELIQQHAWPSAKLL